MQSNGFKDTKSIDGKVSAKATVSASPSSSTSAANDVSQQLATSVTQPPVIPPLVLAPKATKTDKKSQNSFAIVSKKGPQNKDDVRRVTRHSPQNSNNAEPNTGSPSKSTTNSRTNSPNPSSVTSLSPNKTNSRQLPTKPVFAHKRSPSSPVPPNPFISSNQVRATKSKPTPPQLSSADPTPTLKANFMAAQKSRAGN